LTLAIEAPNSVAEALALLAREPDRLVVAGGTDVVPALTAGRLAPRPILALGRLAELDTAGHTGEGGLFLGARLTLTRLAQLSGLVPVLGAAAGFGPPGVLTAATVAGNVLTDGDLAVVLAALDATVETDSTAGRRSIPIGDFLADRSGSRLLPGELIVGVVIPDLTGAAELERVVLPGHGTRSVLTIAMARGSTGPRVALRAGDSIPCPVPSADAVAEYCGTDDYLRHAAGVCARRLLNRLGQR
jgi:CO/xanthine dehydrogenase FAD-binding subunit